MNKLTYRSFYQRNLPHYQPPGATLFITFRVANSIPKEALLRLQAEKEQIKAVLSKITDPQERTKRTYLEQRRFFGKWDKILDSASTGPFWLRNPRIAELMVESIHHRDGKVYNLDAFCVMPNHVHMIFAPLPESPETEANAVRYHALPAIMHSLKLYTAGQANKILNREGNFWQHENYDHVVRDEAEWRRIVEYVLSNPVKAELVKSKENWPWSYCKYL